MPVPYHARQNLTQYLDWVGNTIEYSGGYLDTGGVNYLMVDVLVDDDEIIGAILPKQRIRFHDGTRLDFHQFVTNDCIVFEYSYHYMLDDEDGTFLCRLDKHRGHEGVVGGLTHLHVPVDAGGERIVAAHEYDFDDALEFVRRYAGVLEAE